jgi:hypothetical protein
MYLIQAYEFGVFRKVFVRLLNAQRLAFLIDSALLVLTAHLIFPTSLGPLSAFSRYRQPTEEIA